MVTTKKNLGKLFGGKIASINYNFQPSSQPSTATVTVVNENQIFNKPDFGSTVSIPPFSIQMDVVSVTENKEGYKYLQVELVEHSHNILDKELVLIYGVHTTHQSELNNESYYTFKSYFVEDSYWKAPRNPEMESARYPNNNIRSKDGINILGIARATIADINTTPVNKNYEFVPDATYLKFDKGAFRSDISTAMPNNWEFDENGPPNLSVEYGYYLTELRDLIKKLGMRFADGTDSYLNDESVLFSESGTLREVLTSVLSKIGMSFYVDPLSQKIKIVTNVDVARINANIRARHKFFNEACASQSSYSESIKGVEARHLVLKGNLNQRDDENGPSGGFNGSPVQRTDKLYRVAARDITGLSEKELNYVYRFLPLVLMGVPEHIIDAYIFGTAVYEETTDWGDLYGKKDFEMDSESWWRSKGKATKYIDPITGKEAEEPNRVKRLWDAVTKNNGGVWGYFNAQKDGETAKRFGREIEDDGESKYSDPIMPRDKYLSYLISFAQMWGGIYVSDAMNLSEAEARQYSTITKRGQTVKTFIASSDAKITEFEDLKFLVNLLRQKGKSTDVSINDLAKHTSAILTASGTEQLGANTGSNPTSSGNTGIAGSNFHVIALQGIGFEDEDVLPAEISKFIDSRLKYIPVPIFQKDSTWKSGAFLFGTKDFRSVMKSLRRNLDKILRRTLEKRGPSILISFFKAENDNSVQLNEDAISPFFDKGSPNYIKNIESREKLFYKRSLDMMQMGVSEIALFLENFGILNREMPSPLISSSIRYDRAPLKSDFNIEEGLNNLSVSISSNGGITTSISYSSRRFIQIDKSIARDYLGSSQAINKTAIPSIEPDYRDAAHKNFIS